ncbi:MAG TPA: hypothetical protein VNJ54_00410 [Plantibacter sp.]|uniref:hypothetical protein n=1 Tax=Plantibacter sp. TaxID=1871045 RepID=UPI002C860D0C|nr:hypothetical protein [Plantibacter sp.]
MPNRAIDQYEDAIVAVLAHCDDGMDLTAACEWEVGFWILTSGRLKRLVETWCAVAGIEPPS